MASSDYLCCDSCGRKISYATSDPLTGAWCTDCVSALVRERDEACAADAQKTREWNVMSAEARKYFAALKAIFNVPGVDGRLDLEAVRRGQDMRASEQMRLLAAQAIGLSSSREEK